MTSTIKHRAGANQYAGLDKVEWSSQEGAIREPVSLGLEPLLKHFFSLLVLFPLLSLVLKIRTFTIRRDSNRAITWLSN